MVTISLPDGSTKVYESEVTGRQVLDEIGGSLARSALVMSVNDVVCDINSLITVDAQVVFWTFDTDIGKRAFWHSTAHVLAMAVVNLYDAAQLTIGPAIEKGFYYDFHVPQSFSPDELIHIEQKMKEFIKEDIPFVRESITYEQAVELFKDNPFKLELIEQNKNDGLSVYRNGEFVDLCAGPHIPSTGYIKAISLTSVSASYWRGDANKASLQRIYGISFPDAKQLREHVTQLAEAEKRDHRVLAKKLDLAMFHPYSPGAPFFLPKGAKMYQLLVDFIREEYRKRGYDEVITPQLFNKKLWEESGHWEHYRDNMFMVTIEGEEYSLKPMNCPSHCLIYNRESHSYRDLPVRIADFCVLHRNELSGTLSGMTRVRKFAQDDAHIFCTLEQVEQEVLDILTFIRDVWENVFNFSLTYHLSTRPDDKLGDDALWDKAESMLVKALDAAGITYGVKEGDGAFYGPKIDVDLEDALGRKWQCPTCQLDFNLPERFNCTYEGEDGKKHQVVMIHRAVLGSLERFFGILVEHYAGAFPLWISPVQVRVIPIADRHADYGSRVVERCFSKGLRCEIDQRSETLNKKIREAQLAKINYIIVVGDKEHEKGTVNVRTRDNVVHGEMPLENFVDQLVDEVARKC